MRFSGQYRVVSDLEGVTPMGGGCWVSECADLGSLALSHAQRWDTHDRGGLYVMPQLDAKLGWRIKRYAPGAYTRGIGLLERFGPDLDSTKG